MNWIRQIFIVLGMALFAALFYQLVSNNDTILGNLSQMESQRVGKIHTLVSNHTYDFPYDLSKRIEDAYLAPSTGMMHQIGTAENISAVTVNFYGVDDEFFNMASDSPAPISLKDNVLYLNQATADALNIKKPGGMLKVRLPVKRLIHPYMTTIDQKTSVTQFLKVEAILSENQMANFAPVPTSMPPCNIFMNMWDLNELMMQDNEACNLLVSEAELTPDSVMQVIDFDDINVESGPFFKQGSLLRSKHYFMPKVFDNFAGGVPTLSWFGSLTSRTDTATDIPIIGLGRIPDTAIVISYPLADYLGVNLRDTIKLSARVEGPRGPLQRVMEFEVYHMSSPLEFSVYRHAIPRLDIYHTQVTENNVKRKRVDGEYTPEALISVSTARNLFASKYGETSCSLFSSISQDDLLKHIQNKCSLFAFGFTFDNLQMQSALAFQHLNYKTVYLVLKDLLLFIASLTLIWQLMKYAYLKQHSHFSIFVISTTFSILIGSVLGFSIFYIHTEKFFNVNFLNSLIHLASARIPYLAIIPAVLMGILMLFLLTRNREQILSPVIRFSSLNWVQVIFGGFCLSFAFINTGITALILLAFAILFLLSLPLYVAEEFFNVKHETIMKVQPLKWNAAFVVISLFTIFVIANASFTFLSPSLDSNTLTVRTLRDVPQADVPAYCVSKSKYMQPYEIPKLNLFKTNSPAIIGSNLSGLTYSPSENKIPAMFLYQAEPDYLFSELLDTPVALTVDGVPYILDVDSHVRLAQKPTYSGIHISESNFDLLYPGKGYNLFNFTRSDSQKVMRDLQNYIPVELPVVANPLLAYFEDALRSIALALIIFSVSFVLQIFIIQTTLRGSLSCHEK